jgi:O-methyltransferase involved in polyketide biosynthesis
MPVDFAKQDLRQVLDNAWLSHRPQGVHRLGSVTFYLPVEAVEATLRVVGRSAFGESLVFDYVVETAMREEHQDEALKRPMTRNAQIPYQSDGTVVGVPMVFANTPRGGYLKTDDISDERLRRSWLRETSPA